MDPMQVSSYGFDPYLRSASVPRVTGAPSIEGRMPRGKTGEDNNAPGRSTGESDAAAQSSGKTGGKNAATSRTKPRNGARGKDGKPLSSKDQDVILKLKSRDAEVRAHEQAHLAAAGQYARGGPRFEYQTGPDGQRYAIGGEVSVDTSPVPNDPQATISKMEAVRRAALAPAQPSGQDYSVASGAAKQEMKARLELLKLYEQKMAGSGGKDRPGQHKGSTIDTVV